MNRSKNAGKSRPSGECGIYRLETTDWSLEVVDETGASTVWDDLFPTDQAALDEALKTIREEGIRTFLRGKTDIMH